jgi:hypothetical protein
MYRMYCDSLAHCLRPALEIPILSPYTLMRQHVKKAPALQGLDAMRPMIVVSRL